MTLRQGLKPHGFFCHSSVREKRRNAAWLRLGASRSGGGIAEGASPSRRILSWAVPGPVALPCLSERERWPTTSVSGVLGTAHTRAFRRCSPGNVPQRRRLFPMLLFALPHAPSAVQPMVPCLRRSREQSTAVQHGRVFTGSPSLPNPYTMQLERDYMPLLFVCVISGNSRANTSTRLTPWVLHHRGLRRAEAPFCQKRYRHASSHVLLSGDGRTERGTETQSRALTHFHYQIDVGGHYFLGLSLQVLAIQGSLFPSKCDGKLFMRGPPDTPTIHLGVRRPSRGTSQELEHLLQ